MAYSGLLDKINIDRRRSEKILNWINESPERMRKLVYGERKDVEDLVENIASEATHNGNFPDLDKVFNKEIERMEQSFSFSFSQKEIALQVYLYSSEHVWERWQKVQRYTNSGSELKMQKAHGIINELRIYLELIRKVEDKYEVLEFSEYNLEDLNLIFEDFSEADFIEADSPKSRAAEIVKNDKSRLEKLEERNRRIDYKLDGKEEIISSLVNSARSYTP